MAWHPVPEEMNRVFDAMASKTFDEKSGTIHDVKVKSLKKWVDQRGFFIEQLKRGDVDDAGHPMMDDNATFAQMSRSLAFARGGNPPELIKAFHWHKKQWDYWDIIQGNTRVVLVDARESSPTAGTVQVVFLGEHSPKIVAIPPGVLHGYQCLDTTDVILNYYVTEPYDPNAPDEGRIAWNDPRIGFDWRIENI